jgi:3',5'-cyclic AMP phosphodiesterase CpdA
MRWTILADVHLGTAATQFPGQHYTYTADLLRRAVARVDALRAERVFVLGDLVNMGVAEEYDLAGSLLAPLRSRLEPLIGNHELVKGSVADFERFFGVRAVRELERPRQPGSALEAAALVPPVFLLNSGVEGLPLTEWRGRLGESQLDWLRGRLERVDGPVIVMCHHPLAGTVRRSTEPMMSLDDSLALRSVLDEHGGEVLLFSGHTHYQSIVRRGRITCIGCPPLAFWPHGVLVVDFDGPLARLRTERLIADHRHSPDARAADAAYRALGEGAAADQAIDLRLDRSAG